MASDLDGEIWVAIRHRDYLCADDGIVRVREPVHESAVDHAICLFHFLVQVEDFMPNPVVGGGWRQEGRHSLDVDNRSATAAEP